MIISYTVTPVNITLNKAIHHVLFNSQRLTFPGHSS